MHVCMCVSVYLCMYVSVYLCMYVCMTDVMHIPDPKHGSGIRANLGTAHASVLRVCVAQARPPTWCVTLVPEASPVLGAKTDTQNSVNGRAPTVGSPPVGLVFGYRNRPPELGLPPRSIPVSCVEFWLARPQTIFEFVNHSITGLLVRPLCERPTINQLRPDVD